MARRQRYRVRWTRAADQDLESIVDFIARDNIGIAVQVLNKLRKAASKLETLPERGRIVPELADFGVRIYREILCPPWRIIYRISDRNLFVMAVVDCRRNVEDILLERLTR